MPTAAVCAEDEQDLLSLAEGMEHFESEGGVWMRSCPQCNGLLCKSSPSDSLRCICGWEWQA